MADTDSTLTSLSSSDSDGSDSGSGTDYSRPCAADDSSQEDSDWLRELGVSRMQEDELEDLREVPDVSVAGGEAIGDDVLDRVQDLVEATLAYRQDPEDWEVQIEREGGLEKLVKEIMEKPCKPGLEDELKALFDGETHYITRQTAGSDEENIGEKLMEIVNAGDGGFYFVNSAASRPGGFTFVEHTLPFHEAGGKALFSTPASELSIGALDHFDALGTVVREKTGEVGGDLRNIFNGGDSKRAGTHFKEINRLYNSGMLLRATLTCNITEAPSTSSLPPLARPFLNPTR
ncbi:hypothetical protein Rt10032_c06g2758 [Rhodotorula toruloides]|uniref:Uncharacterized protein n=1 Tax=Rhodotorula toruloides TaxID=5286 RepID=A0A511KEE1_RHOTO|nr:hypothetical protein Rt10032_c06g2758 [Rhodotorula toruloides]